MSAGDLDLNPTTLAETVRRFGSPAVTIKAARWAGTIMAAAVTVAATSALVAADTNVSDVAAACVTLAGLLAMLIAAELCGEAQRDRRQRRALVVADERFGWRPRDDAPHPPGRDDTYDRYLIEVRPTDTGLEMGLRRYKFDPMYGRWRRTAGPWEGPAVRCADDACQAGDARAQLAQRADALHEQAQARLLEARRHEATGGEAVGRADRARFAALLSE